MRIHFPRFGIVVLIIIAAGLLPLLPFDNYWMENLDVALVYVILVLSLNLAYGFAGQLSLGHAGLFAIGAYVSAIVTVTYHQGFIVGLGGALAAGLVAGAMIGAPSLRLRSHYLAFATLGFGAIVQLSIINLPKWTGGSDGFVSIPSPVILNWSVDTVWRYYYLLLAFVILVGLMSINIQHSKLGRALIALREDELAARQVGVNTATLKIFIFVVSAGIAALAGSLYAHLFTFISPDAFSFTLSIQLVMMMIVGGAGTISGSIIGAVVVTLLPEILRFSQAYYGVIFGLSVLVVVAFMPDGIVGLCRKLWALTRTF